MATLEDSVQDLYNGETRVQVRKDAVEPLSDAWKASKINLPHKGSKGSWRNGRLHAHDMGDHYEVHLDRVDPEKHGFSHLVQDAPLVFFFWTQFSDAGRSVSDVQKGQELGKLGSWAARVAVGAVLIVLGIVIATEPLLVRGFLFIAAVLGLLIIGGLSLVSAVRSGRPGKARADLILGVVALVMAGLVMAFPKFLLVLLFLVLTIWTLGSALFLMFGRGEKLLFPKGSVVPFLFGIGSLILAIVLIINPSGGVDLIIFIAGAMVAFIGIMQILVGLTIRSASKRAPRVEG